MTYQKALTILNYSGNLPAETYIKICTTYLENRVPGRPLRYSVAARTIIEHLQG